MKFEDFTFSEQADLFGKATRFLTLLNSTQDAGGAAQRMPRAFVRNERFNETRFKQSTLCYYRAGKETWYHLIRF